MYGCLKCLKLQLNLQSQSLLLLKKIVSVDGGLKPGLSGTASLCCSNSGVLKSLDCGSGQGDSTSVKAVVKMKSFWIMVVVKAVLQV